MGIFGAMTTAVSGLRAQSYALETISGNIANSQTTGFKRVDTRFVDLVPELSAGREIAGSVTAFSRLTNTLPGLTVDGVPVGNVDLRYGNTGLTQYATSSGLVRAGTLEQDGYPSGVLDSIQILSDGRIAGSYTNGRVVPVAEIPIVQFNADNALRRLDSGVYERTLESGLPIVGLNGSTLIGGHVEGSNTDIAEEFSKMIVTQQAYSANTRVVSTSQQMITEIINMVR
jgi:flagellar hook protein FlgE